MYVCCLFSFSLLWSPSLGEDTGEINGPFRPTSLHQNWTSSLRFVCVFWLFSGRRHWRPSAWTSCGVVDTQGVWGPLDCPLSPRGEHLPAHRATLPRKEWTQSQAKSQARHCSCCVSVKHKFNRVGIGPLQQRWTSTGGSMQCTRVIYEHVYYSVNSKESTVCFALTRYWGRMPNGPVRLAAALWRTGVLR